MLYAGKDGPIGCIRLANIRDGLDDYEYLWLLKEKGKEAQTKAIVDSVCPAAEKWSDDPEAWDKARLELARMLNKP